MCIIYNITSKQTQCLINPNIADLDVDPALNPAKLEANGEEGYLVGCLVPTNPTNNNQPNPNNPNPTTLCLPLHPLQTEVNQFLEDQNNQ